MDAMDVAQRYVNAWNRRDAGELIARFADGGTYCDPAIGQPLTGQAIAAYLAACGRPSPTYRSRSSVPRRRGMRARITAAEHRLDNILVVALLDQLTAVGMPELVQGVARRCGRAKDDDSFGAVLWVAHADTFAARGEHDIADIQRQHFEIDTRSAAKYAPSSVTDPRLNRIRLDQRTKSCAREVVHVSCALDLSHRTARMPAV